VKFVWLTKRSALWLLLGLVAWGVTACATTEDTDNASVRPWNTPKGWENGLPSNLTEGR
jgi:hypothetical protein